VKVTGDLAGLREAYERNIQSLGGICSPISDGASSVENNLRWLTPKVGCLLSTAIEGVLVMAGDSVDLEALQTSAADNGVDVLPGAPGAGCPESRPSHYTKLVAFLQL
jgi:hypothetical protein